jgi:N-methylhydantoinase A
VREIFSGLVARARESLSAAGFKAEEMQITRSLDMRYRQQVHELSIPFAPGTADLTEADLAAIYQRFDEFYELTYGAGAGYREAGKEIMAFRVVATGALKKPKLRKYPLQKNQAALAEKKTRPVYFEEFRDYAPTKIYDYERLAPGSEISGPAVIETPITTIVVNPKDRALIDEYFNIRMYLGE